MKACVVGATGLVGAELLELIPRAWPGCEIDLYASTTRKFEHKGKSYSVSSASDLDRSDAATGDVAFVALDDEYSARYVPRLLALGYRVVDKSNTFRMDPKVPLAVAGVNCDLVGQSRLVANPNCTTIPLAMCLSVLDRRWGLEDVVVSTYQAISGAGKAPLLDFLDSAHRSYEYSGGEQDLLGLSLDASAYVGNTVPHNTKTDDTGFSSEERKLMSETKRVLGIDDLSISVQCCRVPVAVGHYENAWVRFRQPAHLIELERALADARWIDLFHGSDGIGLTALATVHRRDRALVGRIRRDPRSSDNKSFCMTIAADNIRLGAATNAVRIASRWFKSPDPDLAFSPDFKETAGGLTVS
jgi:aspartate-semialdehyde dehydrogenase